MTARIVVGTALAGAVVLLVVVVASTILGRPPAADAAGAAAKAGGKRTPRPITIAWAGDTTLGSTHGLPPDRGRPLLAGVKDLLHQADLTVLNYEGTLATSGTSKCGLEPAEQCFAFRAPPENATTLRRAGVDLVNLANNHANDYGPVALDETAAALTAAKVGATGRPGQIHLTTVEGIRIASVGFSTYPWTNDLRDLAGAQSLIRAAADAADVVLVLVHAGAEGVGQEHTPDADEVFLGEPRGNVRAFAHAAVDAGADLVLGSGPHVLRGLERYGDRLIAYSLGNLAGYHTFSSRGTMALSGVLQITVDPDGAYRRGRFTSLVLDGVGVPRADPAGAAALLVSDVGRQDFGDAAVTVGSDGTLASG